MTEKVIESGDIAVFDSSNAVKINVVHYHNKSIVHYEETIDGEYFFDYF